MKNSIVSRTIYDIYLQSLDKIKGGHEICFLKSHRVGELEQRGVQAPGHRGEVKVQGEKAVEGNLRRVRGDSGDVFLERAYVEAT